MSIRIRNKYLCFNGAKFHLETEVQHVCNACKIVRLLLAIDFSKIRPPRLADNLLHT